MSTDAVTAEQIDFAVAAWREEGRWNVSSLPARTATSMESLAHALRQLPGEGGVFGFVGVDEDFMIVVRQLGDRSRVLISDGTAILAWSLADEAAEASGLPVDEDELEEFVPFGDTAILADFGVDSTDLLLQCEDDDLYPDDQLKAIARKLGFTPQLSTALKSR